MRVAAFWNVEGEKVRCSLCPHQCLLKEGQTGFCGVRKNLAGELLALSYGKVVSCACDPVEKKPLYHFYPGHKTFSIGGIGCNLRCRHCQNWQISCRDMEQSAGGVRDLPPEEVVERASAEGCRSIVWTYNEPSIWFEYILDTAPLAQEAGLKTVLVTAGMLESEPLQQLLPHIDAYRLDVKGFSGDFYRWLSGIDCFAQILRNGEAAVRAGCHVEIVTNLIPGHNDDEGQLRGLARWIAQDLGAEVPWHLTAYYPSHKLQVAATGVEALERGVEIGREEGLKHLYVGNIPGHNAQHSYCANCDSLLLQRTGFTVTANHLVAGTCPKCSKRFTLYP